MTASVLAYVGAALLGLCLLTGMLSLILGMADTRKMTLRVWLGLVWLATLLVPLLTALAVGLLIAVLPQHVSSTVLSQNASSTPFSLDARQLQMAQVAVPVAAFLVTMACSAWLAGQMVLRPLARMRVAARHIADGDLNVTLPSAPLREVDEVARAFDAMSVALRASIARQAEVEQQRRLFVGAIAHDLRTPLFSLRGYLEGLERGLADTPEQATHYLTICRQQADALEHLVADLFAYTRLEYLHVMPERAPVNLGELLWQTVESVRPHAEEKTIHLHVCGAPETYMLDGDAHLLTRAITNVLDNALRYTPTGGEVRVSWHADYDDFRFLIADTGPGIAAADLPHIFEPLYRVEASRNRATGGAGLGLSIARSILRGHGGDLSATNAPEGGAVLVGTLKCHIRGAAAPATCGSPHEAPTAAPHTNGAARGTVTSSNGAESQVRTAMPSAGGDGL